MDKHLEWAEGLQWKLDEHKKKTDQTKSSHSNFPDYEKYIKNRLCHNRIYYGLWPDGKKIEYDVLYVIPTDNFEEIQKHLNAHNHMNHGVAQAMSLIIYSGGRYEILKNNS